MFFPEVFDVTMVEALPVRPECRPSSNVLLELAAMVSFFVTLPTPVGVMQVISTVTGVEFGFCIKVQVS